MASLTGKDAMDTPEQRPDRATIAKGTSGYSMYIEYSAIEREWTATSAEWPGFVGYGVTREEALHSLEDMIYDGLQTCRYTCTAPPLGRVKENRVRAHQNNTSR